MNDPIRDNHMVIGAADGYERGQQESIHPAFRDSAEAALREAAEEDALECVCSGDYFADLPPKISTALRFLMLNCSNMPSGDMGRALIAGAAQAVFALAVADETERILERD